MGGIFYVTGALADGTVTTAKLAADAVTTAKIADDAITNAKMANNAVDDAVIAALAVTTPKIADQAVTLAKLPHGTSSNDGKFLRANNGADPTFETVSGTTINNNANNRLITGSGTANTLEAETNIIFDGTNLDSGATNDNSVKTGTFRVNHYTHSATNPINVIGCSSGNGYNNVQIGGSDTSFSGTAATGIRFYTAGNATTANGTLRGYFDTSGNLGISDGNLVLASGHGIDFSATANSSGSVSTNGEILDDYEEGTWTPSAPITSNHSNLGTFRYARYVKIGHVVHLWCDCYQSSNNMEIQAGWELHGFPFSVNSNGFLGPANVGTFSYTSSQSSYIPNYIDSGSGGYVYIHTHDWTPLRHMWFYICYNTTA
jgi:hypothetical protein